MRQDNQIAAPTPARWLPRRADTDLSPESIRVEQTMGGREPCFLTEKRLLCKDMECQLRARCCRLVAVWRR
jgi:hypothetical protein